MEINVTITNYYSVWKVAGYCHDQSILSIIIIRWSSKRNSLGHLLEKQTNTLYRIMQWMHSSSILLFLKIYYELFQVKFEQRITAGIETAIRSEIFKYTVK